MFTEGGSPEAWKAPGHSVSAGVRLFSHQSERVLGAYWFQQGPLASAVVRGQHLREHRISGTEAGYKLGEGNQAAHRCGLTSTSGPKKIPHDIGNLYFER